MKIKLLSVSPALSNGQQRTFEVTDKQTGEMVTFYSWQVEVELQKNDAKYEQTLLAEVLTKTQEPPYRSIVGDGKVYDGLITFHIFEYEGNKYNRIRLHSVTTNLI